MPSLKLYCKEDVRRVPFKEEWMDYENLIKFVSLALDVRATSLVWNDGHDSVSVTNSLELEDAVNVMKICGVISFKVPLFLISVCS